MLGNGKIGADGNAFLGRDVDRQKNSLLYPINKFRWKLEPVLFL
ncbi:11281_t:CDS:2 [Rhizophagus irregularis]|nr:11281_t:CDS:2 [Rhizophagus irregularis]